MAKRFFASEIWEEDWFLEMPNEYRWFWFYMLGKCDHAGIFRVNLKSIRGKLEVDLSPNRALQLINSDKQRVRVLKEGVWLIEDFFVFQYGPKFSIKNRVHVSVAAIYQKHGIELTSIRGLIVPNDGVKDKDKDKDYEEVESKEEGIGGMEERKEGKREEGAFIGSVVYDAEKEILSNQIQFERICISTGKDPTQGREALRCYHLHLEEKEQYPKGKKAVYSGFEKWLRNENKIFPNGTAYKRTAQTGTPVPGIVTEKGKRKF